MARDWAVLGELFEHIEGEDLKDFLKNLDPIKRGIYLRHLRLLSEAGYVADVEIAGTQANVDDARITLAGYDFAETVQDRRLLRQTLALIKEAGLMASRETLKQFTPLAVRYFARRIAGTLSD